MRDSAGVHSGVPNGYYGMMATIDNPNHTSNENKMAKHLAGRTVFALRANFPVERVSVPSSSEGTGGIVCDWKSSRDVYGDDVALLRRAFAFVYIGTILDQTDAGALPEDLLKEIRGDQEQSLEVRQCAVEWGVATSIMDTNPFAHVGYKVASQIARLDQNLIDNLAAELSKSESLDGAFLEEWFRERAEPRSLSALEESGRF